MTEEIPEWAKSLIEKVDSLSEEDDLEQNYDMGEEKKRSQMLDLDPERIDSFGDSIELVTKSRLKDYSESFQIAKNFVFREYHNMEGNRYGKHSKLIPVFNKDGTKNKIDMVWFSGNDVKVVERKEIVLVEDENGYHHEETIKQYYKIRLLVYDILTKKLLVSRIPTSDGIARQEEIQHIGAEKSGDKWTQQNVPLSPMKPIKYSPGSTGKTTMKNVGEMVFE